MIYLIDTNVLLRVLHSTDSSSPLAEAAVRKLLSNGHSLHATTQNYIEFWNVSTRPIYQNGIGLSPSDTVGPLHRAEQLFPLLPIHLTYMLNGESLSLIMVYLVYRFMMRG